MVVTAYNRDEGAQAGSTDFPSSRSLGGARKSGLPAATIQHVVEVQLNETGALVRCESYVVDITAHQRLVEVSKFVSSIADKHKP